MTERRITMQSIRYFAQVAESLSFHAHRGMPNAGQAVEAAMKCADHIEHTAQYDVDMDVKRRLHCIAVSLEWLIAVRVQFAAVLSYRVWRFHPLSILMH